MIRQIIHEGHIYAIIIDSGYKKQGIDFFTPDHFSQQLGYMNRPKGYTVAPHKHRLVERTLSQTQEVLIVRSGKVKVTFYDGDGIFLDDAIISTGDILLLAQGGHGFEWLEDAEMIEIKQGPYLFEDDKIMFTELKKAPPVI